MVIETVDERVKASQAVLDALQERASTAAYANDIAAALESVGIDFEKTLWTPWSLIDENRLFLDEAGHLVIEQVGPGMGRHPLETHDGGS